MPDPPIPDFVPVPRLAPQQSGWTDERQRAFIATLAATGSVTAAADAVGLSLKGAYNLRAADGADSFRAAWSRALDCGVAALRTVAYDRAVNGVPVALVWQGAVTGETVKYDNRLLTSVLRQYERQDGGHGMGGEQSEPADVATRLWHNTIRYAEALAVKCAILRLYLTRLEKEERTGRTVAEVRESWLSEYDRQCESAALVNSQAEAGRAGMVEVAGTITVPIRWSPLTEWQRWRAAAVEATLAGEAQPPEPPLPDYNTWIPIASMDALFPQE